MEKKGASACSKHPYMECLYICIEASCNRTRICSECKITKHSNHTLLPVSSIIGNSDPPKIRHILNDMEIIRGDHCITTAIRHIFKYNKHNITEEMLFGIGECLNFGYMEIPFAPMPILASRSNILVYERTLANNLGIQLETQTTSSITKGYKEVVQQLAEDKPVMLYVDMGFLKYLNMPEGFHFGGHGVCLYGLDEDQGLAYISDRDADNYQIGNFEGRDFHKVDLEELELARNSKEQPFPPKNRWVTFSFEGMKTIDYELLKGCCLGCCKNMLISSGKFGVSGIRVFADRVRLWGSWAEPKLIKTALTFSTMMREGTGGGNFRYIFSRFLHQITDIVGGDSIKDVAVAYAQIGDLWVQVEKYLERLAKEKDLNLLETISTVIMEIAENEERALIQLMKIFGEEPPKRGGACCHCF